MRFPKDKVCSRGVWAAAHSRDDPVCISSDRRHVLLSSTLAVATFAIEPLQCYALPLAPLGNLSDRIGGDKLKMPSVDQVKVSKCLRERCIP